MRLRAVWVRVVLVYALIAGLAVAGFALFALSTGSARLRAQAVADLRAQLDQVVGGFDPARPPTDQYDTWVWDTGTRTATPLGQVDVEPPFQTIATETDAGSGTATDTFSQGSTDYLVAAQRIPTTTKIVMAAADRSATTAEVHRLRVRLLLAGAGVVALSTALVGAVGALSLRPVRRAGRQQRDFLANAAHELRTPLAVIQASSSQALRRARSADEYVRALAEVRVAAERAGAGVAQLLELTRLEAGQSALRRGPLRLDLLVEEVVAAAAVDGVTVRAGPAEAVVVDADHGLLRQAIDNVVLNAASRATTVTATTTRRGRHAVVEVSDDGPGFPPGALPALFRRHGRGDRAGGGGLGLAIVREVVEAHGGSVEAGDGPTGARVRLVLPLQAPPLRTLWHRKATGAVAGRARRRPPR